MKHTNMESENLRFKKFKFITIFNRRELCITMNPEERYRICTILSRNNIKYDLVTTNLLSPSPLSRGHSAGITIGMDINRMYEYKIYVHKDDEEEAAYLIRK